MLHSHIPLSFDLRVHAIFHIFVLFFSAVFLLFRFLVIFHPSSVPFFYRVRVFFLSPFFPITNPLPPHFLLLLPAHSLTHLLILRLVRSLALIALSFFFLSLSDLSCRRYDELFMNGTQKQVESITPEGPGAFSMFDTYPCLLISSSYSRKKKWLISNVAAFPRMLFTEMSSIRNGVTFRKNCLCTHRNDVKCVCETLSSSV